MYKGEKKDEYKREKLNCILLNKYCVVKETRNCLLCMWKWFNAILPIITPHHGCALR